MARVFDFDKLGALVAENHLSEIIVLDTNIFISNPRFETWKTAAKDPVFLLSDRVLEEILRVEAKGFNARKTESVQSARVAHNWLDRLLDKGDLSTGVHVKDVGWFVTFDCPSKEELRPEIDRLAVLSDTHGPNDAIFVLLTRHCAETFPHCRVMLLTEDRAAKTVAKWRGTPVYACKQLPSQGFDAWLKDQRRKPITHDWDQKVDEIIRETEQGSVLVTLTLASKRLVPKWPCMVPDENMPGTLVPEPIDVIMAEGYGALHLKNGDVAFNWRVPYRPWTADALSKDESRGEPNVVDWGRTDEDGEVVGLGMIDENDFDFLGKESFVPRRILDGLTYKLAMCEVPSSSQLTGMPTLQSSVCLTEAFLLQKGVNRVAGAGGDYGFGALRDQLSEWLSAQGEHEVATYIDFVTGSWNIGHAVRTRIEV